MKRLCLSMFSLFSAALLAAGCAATGTAATANGEADPVLTTPEDGSRLWLGPRYWGNRLQDWQSAEGRIECIASRPWLGMRTVHDLTRQVTSSDAALNIQVRVDRLGNANQTLAPDAAGGVLIGAGRGEMDYRAAALIHAYSGYGAGIFAGIDHNGQCFIVDNEAAWTLGASNSITPSGALPRNDWRATADSDEDGQAPAQAFDGDVGTLWHSQFTGQRPGHPHEIVIDLGGEQTFAALAYLPRQDSNSGRVGRYDVYASADGEAWGEPIASGTFPDTNAMQVVGLPETTAGHIKLVAHSAQRPQPATSVAELWLLENASEEAENGNGGEPIAWASADLAVAAAPAGAGRVTITITATDPATGDIISAAAKVIDADRLLGNVALVSHPGTQGEGLASARFGFTGWTLTGDGVTEDATHALGPIVSTQYTLSRGVMKMSAQFMPLGENDADTAYLQVHRNGRWVTLASEKIEQPSFSAVFRVADWDDTADTPYRVTYTMEVAGAERETYHWAGTVRRDPVDKPQIVVAGFTGSLQMPWGRRSNWPNEVFFPHGDLTSRVAQHNPDLIFFSGDQLYEGTPTFVDRPNLHTDYLYKWTLHCWAYRGLTRDIPTVTIPDDHDVYQGNVWGAGGRQAPGRDNTGGYVHPAPFVNQVHRTQTAHLPDPYDPTPIDQDISVYYTDLVWGRVSFAVLADRMFKSGCAGNGLPPSGTGRPDHYNNEDFDTADLDLPGLKLLGDRQLAFLDHWAGDWRGSDMKMCLSQTVFANMATHHGGARSFVIADLDSNGWPQTGRNNALAAMRRGFAFHLAGDQHLGTLVHHGIDAHEDAGWSFCVPSVANAYPRAWAPQCPGPYVYPQPEEFLGDRVDGFKNKVTVYAASNPGRDMGTDRPILHDQMPGYGIVIVDKEARTYEAQCWPRSADPSDPTQQYAGWPRTIDQQDNYAPEAIGHLPTINVTGLENPVISIVNQTTGEVVYTLRISGKSFTPPVYEAGRYTVIVSEPDTGARKALRGLGITEDGDTVDVSF